MLRLQKLMFIVILIDLFVGCVYRYQIKKVLIRRYILLLLSDVSHLEVFSLDQFVT
jgi:hypothetical protein